jgi:hypothetical protein
MAPDRDEVLAMLATYGNREPEAVRERIGSLDLAWLVHQVEQRYGVMLDLADEQLAKMSTVDGAVEVLGSVLGASTIHEATP